MQIVGFVHIEVSTNYTYTYTMIAKFKLIAASCSLSEMRPTNCNYYVCFCENETKRSGHFCHACIYILRSKRTVS